MEAETLGERLQAVRLDTPGERGGVTPDLVKEVEGKPIAKRGRIPGITDNPRLKRVI